MNVTLLQRAIITLNARQLAGQSDSHIAAIDPRALLVVTVFYLIAMLSVPVHSVGMLIWFAVYPIITSPLAHIPYERVFLRSLLVLPLLFLIAIFNPVYDRSTAFVIGDVAVSFGWISFGSVIVRGLLSMQALLLLVYVVGFNRMCDAMRRLKMPRVLVTQLLMVYRYLAVLLQESLAMHRARVARGYGRNGYPASMWGSFVGQLLLRTIERGRRVNMAMRARGFDGSLLVEQPSRWDTASTVYCAVWIPVIAAMRLVDLSSLMLSLFRM